MSRYTYTPSPAMQAALDAIAWKTPAAMIKARKNAARALLAGMPCAYVTERPTKIAQRYIRRLIYLSRRAGLLEDQDTIR